MWGNRLGWVLSAISVAAILLFLRVLSAGAERAVPRTDFSRDSTTAAAIELPVDPAVVIPDMTDPGDSSLIYRKAAEQVLAKPFAYDQFARSGQNLDPDELPAIKTLLEATYSRSASFFDKRLPEIINHNNEKPTLDALRTLGQCARRAAMLIQTDRPAEAMKYAEASFSLGMKLYRERITWDELSAGLTLMAENGRLIADLADALGQPERAAAVRRFDAARIAYSNQHLVPVRNILSSPDPAMIERHAGDIIHLAYRAGDRMWRVEAILRLGRYRFHAARLGDQRVAARVIDELTADPDPAIRTAANAARDLTIEQYRLMR